MVSFLFAVGLTTSRLPWTLSFLTPSFETFRQHTYSTTAWICIIIIITTIIGLEITPRILLLDMTRSYDPLVLVYVVLMYPCTSWDGTGASLVVGTPRPLALGTVLQTALAWLPGVTPPVVFEAADAYSKARLCDLPAPGSWDGVSYVLDPADVSDVI